jgi:hypothetical protein
MISHALKSLKRAVKAAFTIDLLYGTAILKINIGFHMSILAVVSLINCIKNDCRKLANSTL